ncbi:MAG: response regulator [Methanolobus sp.]
MSSREKILIIDDEKINIALLTSYLSETYDVVSASSGEEGLDIVRKEEPDLILLDVIMPGIDGFETCKIIKRDYKLDFIPVIMLTSLTSREYHQKGIEVGADDFIKKPADKFELCEKITALLRIKEQHDSLLMDRNKAYEYLDYVSILVAVLDRNYNIIHINKKGADILGYNRNAILNMNWMDLFVSGDYKDYARDKYSKLLDEEISSSEYHEYPVLTAIKEERLFKWNESVLMDDEGNTRNLLISGEDITEKRKDEIKLMEYAEQLKHSNELKDLFTDILRHDLLNPAGLIKSFTEILENTELTEKQKHITGNIKKSNDKLTDLIEGAAQLAKLESMEDMTFTKTNLLPLAREVINGFIPGLGNKEMKLDIENLKPHYALVNPVIEEVFYNLISNAIKYSPDDTIIKVKIDDNADTWKISVTDQGDGIPDSEKLSVFTRFKRLHKENIKGSGIGLAIVKRIMDLHGQEVGVKDNPEGKGSVFWFTLKKVR